MRRIDVNELSLFDIVVIGLVERSGMLFVIGDPGRWTQQGTVKTMGQRSDHWSALIKSLPNKCGVSRSQHAAQHSTSGPSWPT